MTTRTTLVLGATLATLLVAPALADKPGRDWIPLDEAASKIKEAGYADLRKLKADGGRWEGEAIKDGRKVEVRVDPRTGAVTDERDD